MAGLLRKEKGFKPSTSNKDWTVRGEKRKLEPVSLTGDRDWEERRERGGSKLQFSSVRIGGSSFTEDPIDALIKLVSFSGDMYQDYPEMKRLPADLVKNMRSSFLVNQGLSQDEFSEMISSVLEAIIRDVLSYKFSRDKSSIDPLLEEIFKNYSDSEGTNESKYIKTEDDDEHVGDISNEEVVKRFSKFLGNNNIEEPITKWNVFIKMWNLFKTNDKRYLMKDPRVIWDCYKR